MEKKGANLHMMVRIILLMQVEMVKRRWFSFVKCLIKCKNITRILSNQNLLRESVDTTVLRLELISLPSN